MTKVRACKGVGQEWSLGVTFHALGSVKECERMNPHTSKCVPTLGVGILMNFQRVITRVKTHWIKKLFISLESSWNLNV
jgi:hypothetical protein